MSVPESGEYIEQNDLHIIRGRGSGAALRGISPRKLRGFSIFCGQNLRLDLKNANLNFNTLILFGSINH